LKGAYEVQSVRIKVIGSKEALEEFIRVLQSIFPVLVSSPVLPNDRDSNFHVFLNLNPFLKSESIRGRTKNG